MKQVQFVQATRRILGLGAALLLAQSFTATTASAQLTINRNFTGGAAPGNLAGGGNLQDIFNAACDWWEHQFCMDSHTVTLQFRWGPLSPGVLGSHTLLNQGGFPNRETLGRITFDNDGSSVFFADPTPNDASEFRSFVTPNQDLGGGPMNVGRLYRNAVAPANGRFDLFTIAKHEIGHALGLSSANSSFQAENGDGDIDVKNPLPFVGSEIPTSSGSAHVDLGRALMSPGIAPSNRKHPCDADILANAEISNFTQVYLGIPPEASSATRNGTGVNPTGYTEVSPAILGENWVTNVDLSNGAALSIVFAGLGGPATTPTSFGELLVSGPLMTATIDAGTHTLPIPVDCSFVGLTIATQASTLGPPPIQLQNAIDITIGWF